MDWQKGEESQNVEVDQGGGGRGFGGFGGGRLGIGGLLILALLGWIFFKNPLALLSQGGGQPSTAVPNSQPAQVDPQQMEFVRRVLGSTEKTWGDIFAGMGRTYVDPKLDLFSGGVNTACGAASTAVGPFYCPADQKVYLDLDFFRELETRFHSSGDFARAYVIAHEVGHHVQNQLGIFAKTTQMQRQGATMQGATGLSVRQELQADCFAGVWANRTQQRLQWLQPGDVESALNAASQIGDDTLQREARGTVVPDSFTHGTSEQRVKWFKTGLQSGDIRSCDTFSGAL
ncbi:KPN_02809 family neutral zinc metallopeptidase [Dyella nitratireducens]|uniref:Neutral zinc metallopeptidase n=1 Tax=Dyella nitratireducens TaxID=1849580 RepID=A0ABQ1G3P2_9GAMM|nr:neutral zinc metallopeptidase [Dyella nitratireducens]GGA35977.1 neutral zinc metallopeptidase [Dyella nitratireducens]GLQ41065.1 neutral zinc metallopeptidase [Dyella nitratireducens]